MDIWQFPSVPELTATIFPDGKPGSVFAILDSAVWADLPSTLSDSGATYCLLTKQNVSHALMLTMPYLVELNKNEPITEIVVNQVGTKKGIFLRAEEGSGKLYDLFGDLVMVPHVHLPGDVDGWFRFYDPTVLGAFLSFATKEQISILFGQSVTEYFFEDEYTSSLRSFTRPEEIDIHKNARIKFSQDQIEILDEAQHEYLHLQIMKKTWQEMPKQSQQGSRNETIDPRPAFKRLLDIAEESGITKQMALEDFAFLATIYGFGFPEYPEVREYLAVPERSEIKKIRGLEALLKELANANPHGALS